MASALKHTATKNKNTHRSWDCTVAVPVTIIVVDPVKLDREKTTVDPFLHNAGITVPLPASWPATVPTTGATTSAIAFIANLPRPSL